jgi:hypothetical protein
MEYLPILKKLVDNCRNTHEIYATYSSLLIVSPEIAQETWLQDRYHSSYLRYVEQAKDILNGIDAPHLQLIALNSLSRLCFQSADLARLIEEGNPYNITENDYPDFRFSVLLESLKTTPWETLEAEYAEEKSSDPLTKQFLQQDGDNQIASQHGESKLNELTLDYGDFLYRRLSGLLADQDLISLDKDDHLQFLPQLLAYVEQIVPAETSIAPLKQDTAPEADFGLSEYENETIHLHDPMPAIVMSLDEFPIKDWKTLQSSYDGHKHIYIVSRITERFVEQFRLDLEDRQWLLREYPDFVVAILSPRKADNQRHMLIMVLDTPKKIKGLDRMKLPMLSNSSMLLLGDEQWEPWYEALEKYSTHTVLFDLSPSIQIERISHQFDAIEYAKFHLEWDNSSYPFICLVGRRKTSTALFLLPGSEIVINILHLFIEQSDSTKLLNKNDNKNDGILMVIRFCMQHLLDEAVFDFQALNSKYAKRCFDLGRLR